MSSSQGKKIIRKVFYATGEAMAEADKIKGSLIDIAKSFQVGYHLQNNEPSIVKKENGKTVKPPVQQLEGLYGYLGRIIYENITNKKLSFEFLPEFDFFTKKAGELIAEISPKEELVKREENIPLVSDPIKIQFEDSLVRLNKVVSLSRLNTPQARLTLLEYCKDRDSLVRRVIVNCIDPEGQQEEIFAIVKFINDPDEDVARIAIRKSAKIRNRLAFTYLISKLESENVKIRKEAIDALILITGSDLGFNPSASDSGRKESVLRWKQVWQDNQMNPQFLINDEATRSVVKRKHDKS